MRRKSRNFVFLVTLVTTGLLFVAVVQGQQQGQQQQQQQQQQGQNSKPNGARGPKPGATAVGQGPQQQQQATPNSIPNGANFPNPWGTASTYSTAGSVDLTGPFFQSLGTNGRTCGSCHQPSDGMSVSAAHVQQRFVISAGLD